MGKLTISMAMFNSKLLVITRPGTLLFEATVRYVGFIHHVQIIFRGWNPMDVFQIYVSLP